MRTLLGGELTQAQDYNSDYYVKLEVQNGSGTWIDVGAALGRGWIINAKWGEHVNTPVAQATFVLLNAIRGDSLEPLMSASVLNVDDTMAYSPLLEIGRLIRASTATMARGVALDTGKYREVFSGRIDDVESTDTGVGAAFITLPCSDLGAWLMDTQIENETGRYGSEAGEPLEDVLQEVTDDYTPVGEPAVTVVKDSSSNFNVTGYAQGAVKLLQALITLVLDSTGEDIRYRYDASHVLQLTWFNPDRARVTVDATFALGKYVLKRLNRSLRDIRNDGEMSYVDSGTEDTETVFSEDAASKAKFRKRWFRLPISPLVTTSTDAQNVLDAVVNDLSGPEAEFSADGPYLWFVQLYDRYTFTANNRQFDQDQTLGIVGYQHSIENGRGSTTMQCAGRIVGAYAEWLKRLPSNFVPFPFDVEVPPLLSYTVRVDADQVSWLSAKVQGGAGTYVTRALARIDREPTGEELDAASPSPINQRTGIFTDICELEAGKRFYVAGRAYSSDGLGTAIARVSEVWLGLDSTPGADVIIGTIIAMADQIVYPVAFDNECAYCEVWTREYTSNPGSTTSVENLSSTPFKVLTLGVDAFVPGVANPLSIPLAGPDNYQMTTFVPFDHLGKRGNVQTKLTRGSSGELTGPPGGPQEEASLIGWFDAIQESYSNTDDVPTATDFSGEGNDAAIGVGWQPVFTENVTPAGGPAFEFASVNGNGNFSGDANTVAAAGEPQYLVTPILGVPTAGLTVFIVAKRSGSHVEHGTFYRFSPTTGIAFSLKETHGGDGSTDKLKFGPDQSAATHIIASSVTTDWFIHAVRIESTSLARQYYNAVQDATTFDPPTEANSSCALLIGTGANCQIAEMQVFDAALSDASMDLRFAYLSEKHFGDGTGFPPLGTAPDPPANAVQIDNSPTTITVTVTMPASAPDYIRVFVDFVRSFDVAVSVGGGADQDIVIDSLSPGTSYNLAFASVEDGLSSTTISITGATDTTGGTLDTIVDLEQAYSIGDQNGLVRADDTGLNHPLGTAYHTEVSLVTGGPYTGDYVGYDDGFGALMVIPHAQTTVAHLLYYRTWATKASWTDSAKSAESSIFVPAR